MSQKQEVRDEAPTLNTLTGYDVEHRTLYLRLLDAQRDRVHWEDVARILLNIDPNREPQRARRVLEQHLVRAHWMLKNGFGHLLKGGAQD